MPVISEPSFAEVPADRSHLEGERKQVTVLFADLKGSMALSESRDPEEWAEVMDRFFSLCAQAVTRFEGTVDKFTGDGLMAIFGAPRALEDHARRACLAAWHLTEAVGVWAEKTLAERGLDLHVRVGLNSGEVVAGRIGEEETAEYTAVGHTVGLAQRMEAMAEPGRVYLTERTARLVSGYLALTDLGRLEVKGVSEPVGVFALENVRMAGRSSAVRFAEATPLVGRDEEMAALESALARAEEGQAQVVGIVGEAGVGKSRLCEEFSRRCGARGLDVRRTAGVSHGQSVPLVPVLVMFRDYFGIADADSPQKAREKIAGRLVTLDPALAEGLPVLFDFLEVPDPERPAPQLSGEARMRRVFDVLRRVTQRRSERQTLVLIVEDLHWFDPQSATFLERLIPSFPGTRTLVVTNFRPEFHASWMAHSYYRQLALAPLADDDVERLLAAFVGDDESLAALPEHVIAHTGGNPFFIEEVVRTLVEDGTLAGHTGAYRLTRPLDQIGVPATVQAVLAARIDRLRDEGKQVLQTAAVIGRSFPAAILSQMAALPEDDLFGALAALCAAEFLQEETAGDEAAYRFWHPLTQEVAYSTLLAGARRRLHAAAARAIIDLEPGRLDERAALVASHWERAGDDLEAARWNARAAARALRSDLTEAMRRWRAVLVHLAKVPETDEVLRLGIRARVRLSQFGNRTGMDPAEGGSLLIDAKLLAERLGDRVQLAHLIAVQGTHEWRSGRLREGAACSVEAARIGDELGQPGLMAGLLMSRCSGPVAEAIRLSDRAVALCAGDPDFGAEILGYSPLARAHLNRAELFSVAGRLPEAGQESERGLEVARSRSELELVSWALTLIPRLADFAGEGEDSLAAAEEAVRISADSGNLLVHVMALQAVGIASLVLGRWGEAFEAFDQAIGDSHLQAHSNLEDASLHAHLARAHLALGDQRAARQHADDALSVAQEQGARVLEGAALLVRAQVRRAAGEPAEAVATDLDAALAIVHETGALTYEPFIREELGRLRHDPTELREALRLYTAIGATGHARRLESTCQ
jgi:adenylate cyclase